MNYTGIIIEESLEDRVVLGEVKILSTQVELVKEGHKTPWLKQWTLRTVEIPEEQADKIAEKISHALDSLHAGSWYVNFLR